MMSSGSTVFFFDFDIFSIEPISIGSPVEASVARLASPITFDLDVGRLDPVAVLGAIGFVDAPCLA